MYLLHMESIVFWVSFQPEKKKENTEMNLLNVYVWNPFCVLSQKREEKYILTQEPVQAINCISMEN